jgi:hypothetical protein
MEIVIVIVPIPGLPIAMAAIPSLPISMTAIPRSPIAIVGKAAIAPTWELGAAIELPTSHSRTGKSRTAAPWATASHTLHMAAESGATTATAAEGGTATAAEGRTATATTTAAEGGMASAAPTPAAAAVATAATASTTTSASTAMSDEDDGAVMDGTNSVLKIRRRLSWPQHQRG